MPYRLPLSVKEKLTGFALVDADGRMIAFQEAYPWFGVSIEKTPDFVRANFEMLAAAANGSTSQDQVSEQPSPDRRCAP